MNTNLIQVVGVCWGKKRSVSIDGRLQIDHVFIIYYLFAGAPLAFEHSKAAHRRLSDAGSESEQAPESRGREEKLNMTSAPAPTCSLLQMAVASPLELAGPKCRNSLGGGGMSVPAMRLVT